MIGIKVYNHLSNVIARNLYQSLQATLEFLLLIIICLKMYSKDFFTFVKNGRSLKRFCGVL